MYVVQNIIVGTSPFVYINSAGFLAQVFILGGTVSAIEFSRDGVTFFSNALNPFILLASGDRVRVTWSVKPTMTLVPMGYIS
jgi:hypothetical protein